MDATKPPELEGLRDLCPFLEPERANGTDARGEGYCMGLPKGLLMVPTGAEYRALCSTGRHPACPIYRSRRAEDALEAWLRARSQPGGLVAAAEGNRAAPALEAAAPASGTASLATKEAFRRAARMVEWGRIVEALAQTRWSRTASGRLLQASYQALLNRVEDTAGEGSPGPTVDAHARTPTLAALDRTRRERKANGAGAGAHGATAQRDEAA